MMPTEFTFTCQLCGHREGWTTNPASQAAASWHIYNDHREAWVETIGSDRAPHHPAPETQGRQFEDWELQS